MSSAAWIVRQDPNCLSRQISIATSIVTKTEDWLEPIAYASVGSCKRFHRWATWPRQIRGRRSGTLVVGEANTTVSVEHVGVGEDPGAAGAPFAPLDTPTFSGPTLEDKSNG